MSNPLSISGRIIAALSAVLLTGAILLPIWRIELSAPQYPEGLVLKIHANTRSGDVEIGNGLNHYRGMRALHEKDFIEFAVLPYIIGALIFFGLLSVVINRRWFFLVWAAFFFLFAATAMIDFYRWEYNYGHNLDPSAPIQVPGMSYQPPLIGFKQLLNFGAYSIPDAGGWLFIAAGLLLSIALVIEFKKMKKPIPAIHTKLAATSLLLCLMFTGCDNGPQPFRIGKDACDFCKMTITDNRFGGEVVSDKGKVFKFDDTRCITSFLRSHNYENVTMDIYLVDFSGDGHFVKAENSFLYKSDELRSPMGGNVAAFASNDSMTRLKQKLQGIETRWNEINQ
jgi:copper chaperone NosL